MKMHWLRAATIALAASAGVPAICAAQQATFHISDSVVEPIATDPTELTTAGTTTQTALDDYYAPASYNNLLGDSTIAGPACEAPAACGCTDACDSGCGRGRGWLGGLNCCWPCAGDLECLGEPCLLADHFPCFTERGGVIGGWLAQSYVWNPYQPEDNFNGPMTWTDRANEYQMNEVYFYAGRAANTEGCGWDWGWRTDMLYGTNYRWNTSGGFETPFGNNQFYGGAVPQLYAELAYNDLSVKMGRFYSPVGYYVVGQANNFFPVLPYTFQYGEPFTHTGALATYKWSDSLTVGGGVTHGWDASDNTANPHAGGLVTATWTIDDQRSLAYVGVFGPEPNLSGVNTASNGVGYTNRYLQTLVYINKVSDDITAVFQTDYGVLDDAIVAGDEARWYGANGYLYWNQTCRLQWGLNGEWFRYEGGFRVGSVLPSFGSPNASGLGSDQSTGTFFTRTGYDGSFYRLMFGPKYHFTPNFYGRAAVAADWFVGDSNNPGNLQPFDNGTRDHQQVMVFDLIATF
jgi:hypothetical protein